MQLSLMNAGSLALTTAAGGGPLVVISTYSIGSSYNFTPDLTATNVLPQPAVFSGTNETIYKTIVNVHEVIFTVYLPYNLELAVGNIMLKQAGGAPFLWQIMDQQFLKQRLSNTKHYAGDIYFQSMVLKYPYIVNKMNLDNLPDFYAQGPNVAGLVNVPDYYESESDQISIQSGNSTVYNKGRPIYATKTMDFWWGVPWMMDVADTKTWQINGGTVGDNYIYDKDNP